MLHSEARAILASAFKAVAARAPTDLELSYCQAVAWLETLYGRGGQFAQITSQGLHNWGALETHRAADGSCPPGTAPGRDVGDVCFYVYPTDAAAASAFLTTLLTANRTPGRSPVQPDMVRAMAGSPEDVAGAMKAHGYFGASIDQYAAAIRNALATTSAPGGITDQGVVFRTPAPPGGGLVAKKAPWYRSAPFLAVGAVAVAGAIVLGVSRRRA